VKLVDLENNMTRTELLALARVRKVALPAKNVRRDKLIRLLQAAALERKAEKRRRYP